MRANIEHKEVTTGLLRKTTWFQVVTRVDFSEEEKAIIKQRKLQDTIILEREPDVSKGDTAERREFLRSLGDAIHLKICDLLNPSKPNVYHLRTPLEAKQYEQAVLESLKKLKQYLIGNEGIEEKSKTIEI